MSNVQDKSIEVTYNLYTRDHSFNDEERTFRICYSLHTPESPSPSLPILVMCHREWFATVQAHWRSPPPPTAFNNSRHYWKPNVEDPQLSEFTKITIDAPGFAQSRTKPAGSAWSFDLAAAGVLAILDREAGSRRAVIIGDSMGGAHTGLRAALRDTERTEDRRIAGVVACGTAAEEESAGPSFLSRAALLS